MKNCVNHVNMCLQLKRSGVKSDRKPSSVQKSPQTKPDSSSMLSVNADVLRVRRPLMQDEDSDDAALEAGQPPPDAQQVLTSDTTTDDDLSEPVTVARTTSLGNFCLLLISD